MNLILRGDFTGRWVDAAPECPFGAFRCSAWLFQFRQRTALSELKRSCFRFAPLTLRCRTGMFFQNIPVFRPAYSASRNARASAAFAASIKPYYGLCSKTLDLQPLCGLRKGAEGNPSVCCGNQLPLHSSHRLSSSSCAGVAVGLFDFVKTLDLQPLCGLRKGAEGNPSVCCGDNSP